MDDNEFTHAKALKSTTETLRLFSNSLTRTITTWENFAMTDGRYFRTESKLLQARWERNIVEIQREITTLRSLNVLLGQKLAVFDVLRNNVRD